MIRIATIEDAAAIHAIYAPFVLDSSVTFETELPGVGAMAERIAGRLRTHPWLVWDDGGRVLAYAYAMRFRERAAYDWIAETSIYVSVDARRQGIGRRIYRCLLDVLRLQGLTQAVGVITLPGAPSIALHEAMDFEPAGVWRKAGYKLGQWHDVAVVQRELAPSPLPAAPVIPFAELRDDPRLAELLATAVVG